MSFKGIGISSFTDRLYNWLGCDSSWLFPNTSFAYISDLISRVNVEPLSSSDSTLISPPRA